MAKEDKFPFRPSCEGARELKLCNLFQASDVRADPHIQRLLHVLDIIDTKAGPLVSYNGLLLVVATLLISNEKFLLGNTQNVILLSIFSVFVLSLVFSLIYSLSTIYIFGQHNKYIMRHTDEDGFIENPDVAVNILAHIVAKRRNRYMVAYRLAASSTVLLALHLGSRLIPAPQLSTIFG